MHTPSPNLHRAATPRRRLALLGGVSLLPVALIAVTPRPAHATPCISPVIGSCTGLTTTGNGNITLTNTGTIISAEGIGNGGYTVGTLANEGGEINATGDGIYNDVGGTINLLDNQANGQVIGADGRGIINRGTIGQIANDGTITGQVGIENYGNVYSFSPTEYAPGLLGTLTNTGTIKAAEEGLYNELGTITLLNNSGVMAGGSSGAYNDGGDISTLSNSGAIKGYYVGIRNAESGTIGSLGNTGTISAIDEAILNNSLIGTLDNAGASAVISGGIGGILNQGTIGALINAGTITTTLAAGGANGPAVVGIENETGGTISALTNLATGTISGGSSGIYNLGTIGVLSNAGLITGASSGIDNEGQLNTLTNTGIISAGSTGVDNEGGTISLLSNSGTISGASGAGILNTYNRGDSSQLGMIGEIDNAGSISSIVNADTIGGADIAISNTGNIQLLANTGMLYSASDTVIYNGGDVGTLSNSGTIGGTYIGIYNESGRIDTLDNQASGLITSTEEGIQNNATILALDNSGTLSSNFPLFNTGTIVALDNAGAIIGIDNGFSMFGGLVDTLINTGTITAAYLGVRVSDGTIISMDNQATGLISGANGSSGMYNAATVMTLSNEGRITGGLAGLYEYETAYIGALDNTGTLATISGASFGVYNTGGIGALVNDGTIISTNPAGTHPPQTLNTAVFNATGATIDTLENGPQGLISAASTGIGNEGSIGQLSNDGTIIGATSEGVFNDGGTIGTLLNGAGGTIDGGASGITNTGVIGALTNHGAIIGGSATGIQNYGGAVIGGLTNTGLIGGEYFGIDNQNAFIGLLQNSGTITAGSNSAILDGGTAGIGTLSNSGTISGPRAIANSVDGTITLLDNARLITGTETGLVNQGEIAGIINESTGTIFGGMAAIANVAGTIGLMTNNGLIAGSGSGVFNAAPILTLANAGTIAGLYTGIENSNVIGTLLNTGTISGVKYGVNDETGTIGVFENVGLITGGSIAGVMMASGRLENSGTIIGATGVILAGDNASILDSGTIASTDGGDAIKFEAPDPDSLTLTTGAAILGAIDGGATAGSITLEGAGTLNAAIINFTAGSTLDVAGGARWAGAGNWTIATLTNDGQFQGGLIGNPLTLTGTFLQSADGTLLVAVTPRGESQFVVDGTAILAGNLKYAFAPGTYRAGTYPFLTASGGISGAFDSAAYAGAVPKTFTHSTLQELSTGNLVLTASSTTQGGPPAAGVVAPADDAVFAGANEAASLSAQAANAALLGKAAEGAAAASDAAACASQAAGVNATGNGPNVSNDARLAATIGQAFCAAGGWVQATGGVATQNGAAGFTTNMAGFLAGVDAPLNPAGTRLGLAVGYDEDWLKDGAGGNASIGTTRIGLYGSQPLGGTVLAADIMAGAMREDSTRQTGLGPARAKPSGTVLEAGLQAATGLIWNGFAVTPAAGLRVALVHAAAFGETTPDNLSAFAVTGAASTYDSVQPYANVTISHTYVTGNAVAITPQVTAGYEAELAGRGKSVKVTAPDGTVFASSKPAPDASAAAVSAGLAAAKGAWSLYAQYNATISGNWTAQTGEAGIEARF